MSAARAGAGAAGQAAAPRLAAEAALPPAGPPGARCHACDGPLLCDQRYCLACGARRGGGGPIDFATLLAAAGRELPGGPGGRGRALRAPAPVAAAMLVSLLVTGVLLGSLTSSSTLAAGAALAPDVVVRAPSAPPPPAASPPASPAAHVADAAPDPPAGEADGSEANARSDTTAGDETASATESDAEDEADTTTAGDGGGDDGSTRAADPLPAASTTSPIKHVFVIRLGEQAVAHPFAADVATPYLGTTLAGKGTLLADLHTVAGSGLADAIALISGQGPNAGTLAGCPAFDDVAPTTIGAHDQEQGEGCVYSVQTATLANRLAAADLTWRAYVEDQAAGGPGVAKACRRPPPGAPDPWRDPRPGDGYVTARNPFVYFHAITDDAGCEARVADLSALDADLAGKADDVPAFSYIVPNACHDGRVAPCALGAPAGPATADAFLAQLMPRILRSKAYATSLVIVLFDRAFTPPATAATAPPPDAGARAGALLISPYVRPGRVVPGRYDTYSLLAAIEDVFGLEHLGLAGGPALRTLAPGIIRHVVYKAVPAP